MSTAPAEPALAAPEEFASGGAAAVVAVAVAGPRPVRGAETGRLISLPPPPPRRPSTVRRG